MTHPNGAPPGDLNQLASQGWSYVGRAAWDCRRLQGRFSCYDQSRQSSFNHRDLFIDLVDWQAEVVPRSCPGPELERQLCRCFLRSSSADGSDAGHTLERFAASLSTFASSGGDRHDASRLE
jgi:hypothetical protein